MLRRQRQLQVQLQKVVDAGLFCVALWVAHRVRAISGIEVFGGTKDIQPFYDFVWLFLVIFPMAPVWLQSQGFYNRPVFFSRRQTVWQLAKACVLAGLTLVIVLFLFKQLLTRSVIIMFCGVGFVLIYAKEELLRMWHNSHMGLEGLTRRLILVGSGNETTRLRKDLVESQPGGIEAVAEVDLATISLEKFADLLHEHSANGVILSAKHAYFDQIEKVIQACDLEGIEVWLVADFFQTQVAKTSVDDFYGQPMLVFRSTPDSNWQVLAKHALDFFGALIFLFFAAGPMAVIALAIKLTSPGPVFFRQQRSGVNGRPFTMLKFRSMVTNAEQLKQELAAVNEMSGPVFKVTNDPRVTPFGRFMRKYSIDETPQFINVLLGQMSLVGPRPLPVDETLRFDELSHRRRLSVKPGLTCLWQISGRSQVTDFKNWVRLDLEYIDNWSIWLDLKILLKTIPVVLRGTGAK